MKAKGLRLPKGYSAADLIEGLNQLGFSPKDHPTLIVKMQRAFNRARGSRPGEQVDNMITCRWVFMPDGGVSAQIIPGE